MKHIYLDESEHKIEELWWQKRGLMYTATGYGKKIPTRYKIRYGNKWYRVYADIYSNIGTSYITVNGETILVS